MRCLSYEKFVEIVPPAELNSGSVFGALSNDATNFLLKQGEITHVSAGETVFEYGVRGDSFHVVCRGAVDYYKQHEGNSVLTRSIGFGEEIGFVSMIALHDTVGKAIAREESILLEINSGLFHQLHDQYPTDFGLLTLNLARELARTVRKLSNKLVENSCQYEVHRTD